MPHITPRVAPRMAFSLREPFSSIRVVGPQASELEDRELCADAVHSEVSIAVGESVPLA